MDSNQEFWTTNPIINIEVFKNGFYTIYTIL